MCNGSQRSLKQHLILESILNESGRLCAIASQFHRDPRSIAYEIKVHRQLFVRKNQRNKCSLQDKYKQSVQKKSPGSLERSGNISETPSIEIKKISSTPRDRISSKICIQEAIRQRGYSRKRTHFEREGECKINRVSRAVRSQLTQFILHSVILRSHPSFKPLIRSSTFF